MSQGDYLTVGQLARRVGTTVRTIQYYDQQGLLSPSAKGPGNQRLYASEDEEGLYRILTLKYLGLSLADIRDQRDSVADAGALRDVLARTMEALEEDFQDLVKRLSVLRALLDKTKLDDDIDWTDLAHTIEAGQGSDVFFWHQMEDAAADAAGEARMPESSRERGMAIASWHELVADAIALMNGHVAPDDPRAAEVARRYAQLEAAQTGSLAQAFILAENMAPHHGSVPDGPFDALRDSVMAYLDSAKRAQEGA